MKSAAILAPVIAYVSLRMSHRHDLRLLVLNPLHLCGKQISKLALVRAVHPYVVRLINTGTSVAS